MISRYCRVCGLPRAACNCDWEQVDFPELPKVRKPEPLPADWSREQVALHLATVYADDPRMAQKHYQAHLERWEQEELYGVETITGLEER